MKIGACIGTDIEKIEYLKSIGYDYFESHCQEIVKSPWETIEKIKAIGLPVLAANCFIGMRIVGEEKDYVAIDEYLAQLFEKAAYLGIKYLVFGSSAARRIPDGMSLEEGWAEIIDFLKNHVVPLCEKYKTITIAIEPLRPQECNAINTVAQGIEVAKAVDSPYVKVLADLAHVYVQNESFDDISGSQGMLVHAHTSNPNPPEESGRKRIYPKRDDGYCQGDFFAALKDAGVEQCSIEAEVIDFESDVSEALEVLKVYR
jgi:sugar phosphate isomerase/epimerase